MNFLDELAAAQLEERNARRQRIDDATEEYLLGQLQRQREAGYVAPTVAALAAKYSVTQGMIEHKIHRLRTRLERLRENGDLELEIAQIEAENQMLSGFMELLGTAAQVRRQKLEESGGEQ